MMKNKSHISHTWIALLMMVVLITTTAMAAPRFSVATGNWNSTTIWSATSGGAPGAAVPIAGDVVTIEGGFTVTVNANTAALGSLTISTGSVLTVGGFTITVTGATIVTGTINFNNATGAKTFTGDVTLNNGAIWNETAAAVMTFSGNLTNNATTFTAVAGLHTFNAAAGGTISGTTAIVIPSVTFTTSYTNSGTLTCATALNVTGGAVVLTNNGTINATTALSGTGGLTNSATGVLNIGGTAGITTLNATAVGNIVNYNGGAAQPTCKVTTYHNLTLSGAGVKTFPAAGMIVNGVLSLEGTATVSVTGGVVAYGPNATLQYNKPGAYTATAEEWITPFAATGGVVIANTGTITLNVAKVFNADVPLTINNNAVLATNNLALTFNGNFVNNGTITAGTSAITINGTATQSIDGFTTTGAITVSKTGGTVTLTNNVSAASLAFTGANNATLALNSGVALTLTGALSLPRPASAAITLAVNGGSLSCASIALGGTGVTAARSTTLSISTGTVTVSGNITSAGIYSYLTFTGAGTVNVGGNFMSATPGTFAASTGTVNCNGVAAQTVAGYTYNVLKSNNATGVTLVAAATIPTLTIGDVTANSIFNDGGFVITPGVLNLTNGTYNLGSATVATAWPAYTTTNISAGTTVGYVSGLAGGQTVSVVPSYQNLTFSGAAPKNIAAGGTLSVGGNWSLAGGLTTLATTANATVTGNITGAGAITMGSGTITVGGDWTNNGAFTAGTGTVLYNGAAQIVGAKTYNTLTLTGTDVKTLGGAAITNGVLTINNGITLNTSAANNYGLTLNNDFVNSGTFVGNGSNITIGGAVVAQSIDGFTTTGTVTVSKTAGTANLMGNINADTFTFSGNNATAALGTGVSMTLTGGLTIPRPGTTTNTFAVGNGSLSCASVTLGGTLAGVRNSDLTISTGTVTVSGNITSAGVASRLTFTGAGTLNAGGTFMSGNAGTFTASTGTVNFNAGAQAISPFLYTFNNVTLSGNGAKITTNAIINGILSMEETATTAGTIATYGGAATLRYAGTGAQTTGIEFPATWIGSGGVINANTSGNAVTLNANKVVNAPLTINSGTTLATNNVALTFGGDFINNGGTFTAGSSNITISGAVTQSISGFTTTGTVTMTKTAGTATLQGAISSGAMTIDGLGGTLNLGTGLTHTVNDAVTLTAGTLNLGSSTLNLTGNFTGAGTLIGGTGTMNFNGIAAQTAVGKATYNIVKINNAAGVTLTSAATIPTLTVGDLTANSIFNDGGFQITSTGTLNLTSGTFNIGSATVATTWPAFTTTNISAGSTVGYVSGLAGGQTVSVVPSYQNLTFSGAAPKNIAAGGTLSVGGNWSLAGGLTTLATTANATVSGSITGNGAITMGSGTLTVSGDWTNNGTFTQGTGTVNYNGTSTDQIVRGGITYYNLQISNGSTKLLQVGDLTVSNILTLNSGVLRIGDYNLILTNAAVGAIAGSPGSTTNMIRTDGIGYVQKAGAADGTGININYPVGLGGYYNPLDLTSAGFTTTGGVSGNLQIRVASANQGPNSLGKYWNIAINGYSNTITTNLRFTYSVAEANGVQANYDVWYYNGTSWVSAPGTHTAIGAIPFGSNVSSVTAASISGRWSAGSSAPATSVAYYSYQSGFWTDPASWTSDPSGTLWINPSVPGSTDNVTILNGRKITISANTKQVATLKINSGGILDLGSTTGHNFGTVTGQGNIMLSSNIFPGGTYTGFVASNGGTIEYYNLDNSSITTTQFTYNNLIISNYSGSANTVFLINNSAPTNYIINGNFSLKNLLPGTQTLNFGNPTASNNLINMTVSGNFTVDAGCVIGVNNFAGVHNIPNANDFGATAYPVHTLNLYGNFTNNGIVRFTGLPSPFANGYYLLTTTASPLGGTNYGDVQVYFKGATNNTITCNGITDFFRIVIEKGTDKTYTLEVSSSNIANFALYGPNNQGNNNFNEGGAPTYPPDQGYGYGAYYKALFIHYGTLKLNENINIPSLTEGGQDFNLITTAGLWINGATVSTTVSGVNGTGYQAATLYGNLRISAGSFSTGDAAGIVLGNLGTPVVTVEGTGILDASQVWTATGGTNQMSYIQTGGTANFRMQGEQQAGPMLGMSNINSSFTMSGGIINFTHNAFINGARGYEIMDIRSQDGNYDVKGGTVNLNLPSSDTVFTANSTVPFYNLNITRRVVGGAGTTVFLQWNTPGLGLSVLHDLTIGGNCQLDLNTNLKNLSVGHDFTIATGGTFTPATGATNTVTFNGAGSQAFNNNGTITGGLLTNLTITNSSTTTIANDVIVSGTFTIDQNAVLNDGGKYIRARGNIVMSGTNTGLPAGGIYLENNAAQTISGTGTGIFNNLILNKTAGSVTVSGNMSINGALRLAGAAGAWNILNIGNYNLSLGANAAVYSDMGTGTTFDNNRMIQTSGLLSSGGVSKTYSNTTAFIFPFGFGVYYQPASIRFSNGAGITYGTVNIKPVNARHSLAQGTNNALTCFWKTTSTGFSGIPAGSVVHSYIYNNAFVPVPGDEASYVARYYNSSSWITDAALTENAGTNTIAYSAANSPDGEFTAGLAGAFGAIPTLYSVATGNWNVANTWSTTRSGTPGDGGAPTLTSPVVVTNGTTVTITAAGTSSSRLTVEAGGILDLQNFQGHNFGTVVHDGTTGCGTLRIASTGYFPTGDWAYFLGTSGGTVEYYQTTTATTFTLPVAVTSYYNLTTLPYDGSNIILPNTNLTIQNNLTVGYFGTTTASCITQVNAGISSTLEVKGNININQYGVLQYMNNAVQNIIADNDINIASGGALRVRNAGTQYANTLTAYGNITNNGTLDLDPNGNGSFYCNLIFTGSLNKSLSGTTPTRTRLYSITVNKGTSMVPVINVNVDPNGFQMGSGGLNLQNGTFRFTTLNATIPVSAGNFTIPTTTCLSVNGGIFNIATGAGPADLYLNGKLEILSGTVNIGPALSSTSNSFSIIYALAGTPEILISGGALNVYSQIRRGAGTTAGSLNYTQTGGTVKIGGKSPIASRAVFEVLNGGSKFEMSNGSIILGNHINNISPYDLFLEPDIENVTGGTIQFGLPTVTTLNNFEFQSSCSIGNITLEATTNSSVGQHVYELTLIGNLIIDGASSYYNTNGLNVTIAGNFTNNNTDASIGLTDGGYRTQALTQSTAFIGITDKTITGTASHATRFADLEFAIAAGRTLSLSNTTSSNIIVHNNLTITSGIFNDGGNTITLLKNVDNNAVHISPNPTSGGMIFNGTINQGMTGSGTGVFGNIEINNSGHGINMTDNSTINGQLKFTNGYLYIDNYALTLGQSASIAGTTNATNQIILNGVATDGGVTKVFPSGIYSFTYPIGDNGKHTPCTLNFASNTNPDGGTIKVIPVDALHPTINSSDYANYLEYYWHVTATGFSSGYNVTHTYTYDPADVQGTPTNMDRCDNATSNWFPIAGTPTPPTFTFSSTTFLDGSYTIGGPFASLPTLYSATSGNWNSTSVWSESITGTPLCGYAPNGHSIVIKSGHTISLAANGALASSVVVDGVLDAMNTTSHNIGPVSGGGTIRLSGTGGGMFAFPGGSYDGFLSNPTSIVEYYGSTDATMPLTPGDINKPYKNVLITGSGIKYVSAVDIKVLGNITIAPGSRLNNTLYNKDIFIYGNWIDQNTITSGFTAGTGTVHFAGTTMQSISTANNLKETFYNLEINNATGLTISAGDVDINNQLLLTLGNFNTNTHSLTINNPATNAVVGGSVNSFVNGPLRKMINNGSSFQFPVGDAISSARNRFGSISVSNTSTTGAQIWTAQFIDKNPTTDGYNVSSIQSPLQSVINNEYWNINSPIGSANVVLSWDNYTGMSSSATTRINDTKVVGWNVPSASKWNSLGGVVNDIDQNSGTVTTSPAVTLVSPGNNIFAIGAMSSSVLITCNQSGDWNNTSTWIGGIIPRQLDKVHINSSITITLNNNPEVAELTVDNGAILENGGNIDHTLTLSGNLILNGEWKNTGTGTCKISMAAGTSIYGTTGSVTGSGTNILEIAGNANVDASTNLTLPNVSILAGKKLTNNGTVTINSFTSGGTFENKNGSVLNFTGANLDAITVTANQCSNTINYSGTVPQTVKTMDYCNIVVSSTGAKTINNGGTITVNGDMTQISGTPFTIGIVTIQIGGGLTTGDNFINNGDITIGN